MLGELLVQVMTRRCAVHYGEVSSEAAVLIAIEEAATGPGWPIYACPSCMVFHGLTPLSERTEEPTVLPAALVARLIGHREGLPVAPGELA